MIPSGFFSFQADVWPIPVPELTGSIFPLARRDFRHMPGASARMGIAAYADINGFTCYLSGGMLTVNRGAKRIRRTARGAEDIARRQG